jgi:periplasmic divalent cation tolerance protein
MSDKMIVLSTAGAADEAKRIADALVERKQAACVNIVPGVESIFSWEGKVEHAQEWLLVIKTSATAFNRVEATIKELHSYSVPECVAIEIKHGSKNYLNWIAESVALD